MVGAIEGEPDMVGRITKAAATAAAAVAFTFAGASAVSAGNYPPSQPGGDGVASDPPAPTPTVAPPVASGALPATGSNTGEILQIGLAAVVTGGVLVGATAKRRGRTA